MVSSFACAPCEQITEQITGSIPRHTIRRFAIYESRYRDPRRPWLGTLRQPIPFLFRFYCNCNYEEVSNDELLQENSPPICNHLLAVLTLYECQRLAQFGPLEKRILKLKKILDGNLWSFETMHDKFNETAQYSWCGSVYVRNPKEAPTHTVTQKNNTWTCTCKGFQYHKKCKHPKLIQERIIAREEALQNRRELCISLATLSLK